MAFLSGGTSPTPLSADQIPELPTTALSASAPVETLLAAQTAAAARGAIGAAPLPQAVRLSINTEQSIAVTDYANATLGACADFVAVGTHIMVTASAEMTQPVVGAQTLYYYIAVRNLATNVIVGSTGAKTQHYAAGEAQGTNTIFHHLAMGGLAVGTSYRVEWRYYKSNTNASMQPRAQFIEGLNI